MTYFDLNKDIVASLKPYLPTFNIVWKSHYKTKENGSSYIAGYLEFIQDKTCIKKRCEFEDTFASLKEALNEYTEEDEDDDTQGHVSGFSIYMISDEKRCLELDEVDGLRLTEFVFGEQLRLIEQSFDARSIAKSIPNKETIDFDPRFVNKAIARILDIFTERIEFLNPDFEQRKELEADLAKLKAYLTKTFT